MSIDESKVEGLVLEEWMLAAIYAVQSIAADQSKRIEFKFSDPRPGWLTMQVFLGDELKLEINVQKRITSDVVGHDNVVPLHRSA